VRVISHFELLFKKTKKKRARNAEATKGENRKPLAAVSEGSKRRGWRFMRKP
jgi:hypothetical protein